MNILCEGESRFRIHRFTQQLPFWKGTVEFFEDQELRAAESLYEQVAELYRGVAALSAKLSGSDPAELVLPESATDLSFMVSYVLDIEGEEKQKIAGDDVHDRTTAHAGRPSYRHRCENSSSRELLKRPLRKCAAMEISGDPDPKSKHKGKDKAGMQLLDCTAFFGCLCESHFFKIRNSRGEVPPR